MHDQDSGQPVANAHFRIKDSNQGCVTGSDGSFSLVIKAVPVNIEITCIGYESLSLDFINVPKSSMNLMMKPRSYDLNTVTISEKPVVLLYKDQDYSVLDFHFIGDYLALLVFRYQLNRSEIVIMTPDGDTLTVSPVPAVPPLGLYKDVFSNLHYLTKKNEAFQSEYMPDKNLLIFPYRTSVDTLVGFLGRYRFFLKDRLFSQEDSPHGFMTSIGYYSRSEGRKYARSSSDYKGMKSFYSDAVNYHTFRPVPDPIDENESRCVDADAYAYHHMFKKKSCGELFRVSDTLLAFFNYCANRLEIMNADGLEVATTSIIFHLDQARGAGLMASITTAVTGSDQWKWNKILLQDEITKEIYASFTRNGFVCLKKINLETGTPGASRILPFAFPQKIKIFMGEAYFLYKGTGELEKWILYKCALR